MFKKIMFTKTLPIILTIAALAFTQPANDPVALLARAKVFYKNGQFDSTISVIRSYLDIHGREPSTEQLVPLMVEALARSGDCNQIQSLNRIFVKKFPQSPFMPRLWYQMGICAVKSNNIKDAAASFSSARIGGLSPALDSLLLDAVQVVCRDFPSIDGLRQVATDNKIDSQIRETAAYYEFMRLSSSGATDRAKDRAEAFIRDYPRSNLVAAARAISLEQTAAQVDSSAKRMAVARAMPDSVVRIGVLVPLSGYDEETGRRVLQGEQLAVQQYNQSGAPTKAALVVMDTRGSMVETVRKTRELLESGVMWIVGPVLSSEAVAAAAVVSGRNAVMLTPTATDDGIAELGSNIFQMNVPLGFLARSIARYAQTNLSFRDFVILAPLSDYGAMLARVFRDEVEHSGGTIAAEEFFDEEASDFSGQCKTIRQRLYGQRLESAAREKNMSVEKYVRAYRSERADSLFLDDSVLMVGGIFIPADPEHIAMLAPQLAFNRIKGQLLGPNSWHSPKVIIDGKKYVNDAIFSTNLPVGTESKKWSDFAKAYSAAWKSNPDRAAALGYDATLLMLQTIKNQGNSADASTVSAALKTLQHHECASGFVTFDPVRNVNTEAAIMKIKNQAFIRLQ